METELGHPPDITVLVTVYVFGKLVDKVSKPVEEFILNPPGEEVNVPAMPPPLNVGEGLEALIQYGLPA